MQTGDPLPARLAAVLRDLRQISRDYSTLTFTASQEAMTWPLAVLVDEEGKASLWCGKADCVLDAENAEIFDSDLLENFTIADLIHAVTFHIETVQLRQSDDY